MELSEAQIQDLLHLRRLFCGKIGQLARSRKALMSQLPSESIGASHASDKLDQVTTLAEQLRANGSEEYRTYMQYASTFYRGVSHQSSCSVFTVVCFMKEAHYRTRRSEGDPALRPVAIFVVVQALCLYCSAAPMSVLNIPSCAWGVPFRTTCICCFVFWRLLPSLMLSCVLQCGLGSSLKHVVDFNNLCLLCYGACR